MFNIPRKLPGYIPAKFLKITPQIAGEWDRCTDWCIVSCDRTSLKK